MIINVERKTELSLYYLGGIVLAILKENYVMDIESLLDEIRAKVESKLHVDFLYYTLDWLFLLSLIKLDEGRIYYANKEINSA